MFGNVRAARDGVAGSRVAEKAVYGTVDTFAGKSSENLFAPPTVISPGVVLGALHSTSSVTRGEDWDRFIADEVKIRYDIRLQTLSRMELTYMRRLAARVFMTDCLSTLFFKSPPQITIAEMRGDMPSSDTLFEAPTLDEFTQVTTSSGQFDPNPRSLKDLVALFLEAEWAGPESPTLVLLGTEQLMMLIFGNQLIVFANHQY
jgi:hypothetical protein